MIQSGTLTATTPGAIPAGSSVANSGTFNLTTGTQTIGAITGNGSFNVTGSATVIVPSIVQGSASIAPNATLNLTGPGAVANSLTLANSGNLDITGGTHTVGSLSAGRFQLESVRHDDGRQRRARCRQPVPGHA